MSVTLYIPCRDREEADEPTTLLHHVINNQKQGHQGREGGRGRANKCKRFDACTMYTCTCTCRWAERWIYELETLLPLAEPSQGLSWQSHTHVDRFASVQWIWLCETNCTESGQYQCKKEIANICHFVQDCSKNASSGQWKQKNQRKLLHAMPHLFQQVQYNYM